MPIEKSAQRAVERFENGGQFIDPEYILNIGDLTIKKNYDILKLERRIKTYEQFTANIPKGQQPRFIEGNSERFGVAGERVVGQYDGGNGQGVSREEIARTAETKPAITERVLETPSVTAGFIIDKKLTPVIKENQSVVQKIIQALKEAKPIRGKQEAIYSAERTQKMAQALGVAKKTTGELGFYGELGQLKGQMPKVQFESIRGKIGQSDIDNLFIELLETIQTAKYAKQVEKIFFLDKISHKLDNLKFFVTILWEAKGINANSYSQLAQKLAGIGAMLGGWIKKLSTQQKQTPPI